jgi:hypothetical protein
VFYDDHWDWQKANCWPNEFAAFDEMLVAAHKNTTRTNNHEKFYKVITKQGAV